MTRAQPSVELVERVYREAALLGLHGARPLLPLRRSVRTTLPEAESIPDERGDALRRDVASTVIGAHYASA